MSVNNNHKPIFLTVYKTINEVADDFGVSVDEILRFAEFEDISVYVKFNEEVSARFSCLIKELHESTILSSLNKYSQIECMSVINEMTVRGKVRARLYESQITGFWIVDPLHIPHCLDGNTEYIEHIMDSNKQHYMTLYNVKKDDNLNVGVKFDSDKMYIMGSDIKKIANFSPESMGEPETTSSSDTTRFSDKHKDNAVGLLFYMLVNCKNPKKFLYGEKNKLNANAVKGAILNILVDEKYERGLSNIDRYISKCL